MYYIPLILALLIGQVAAARAGRIRTSREELGPKLVGSKASSQSSLIDTEFSEEDARSFAYLSSSSYCDKVEQLEKWTCPACIDSGIRLQPGKISVIDGGWEKAIRLVIGKFLDKQGCLVIFRGTENSINWIRNLEFWSEEAVPSIHCEGCMIHKGIQTIYENIEGQLLKALEDNGCGLGTTDSQALHITGHSLGGGLTHLAMFALSSAGFGILKSYTFEAPRTGNKAFANAFSERFSRKFPVFRITNQGDPVPHLPLAAWGFWHVDTEVFYDAKAQPKICKLGENMTCANQFEDVAADLLFHTDAHCGSPLVSNGNICFPVGCLNSDPASTCLTDGATTCKFPFIYKGVTYNTCAEADWYTGWCATATDSEHNFLEWQFQAGRHWGTCQPTCHIQPWNCHDYSGGQDDAWCANAGITDGYEYKYTPDYRLCGECKCCKRPVADNLAALITTELLNFENRLALQK